MSPPLLLSLLLLEQQHAGDLPPVPTPNASWVEANGECSVSGPGSGTGWEGWTGTTGSNATDPFDAGAVSKPTGHPGEVCPVVPKGWSLVHAATACKGLCDTDVKCTGVQIFALDYGPTPPGYNFTCCFRAGRMGPNSTRGRADARCYTKLPPPPEPKSVHNLSYISARRFPIEGWLKPITMCTEPPLLPFGGFPVKAMLYQPTKHIVWPGASYQDHVDWDFDLSTTANGSRPASNGTAGCYLVSTGPTMSSAGPAVLSLTSWSKNATSQGAEVTYYESVAVAIGRRPYIRETNGTLLLKVAPEVVSMAAAAGTAGVRVALALPFASTPRTVTWTSSDAPGLLETSEQVLSFGLDGLPPTVNQDCAITITLPNGFSFTKWRRFMRVPPPSSASAVLPVQVDHHIKSLLVDGRPHPGNGFYHGGSMFNKSHGHFDNLTEFVVKVLAPSRINQGMIYRLYTYPIDEQLRILDAMASVGFSVMYEMPTAMDDCGLGYAQEMACQDMQNASRPEMVALRKVITAVKDHPAILGYYMCDDCCKGDGGNTAYMAQGYNWIKSLDPYHIVTGATNCDDLWQWYDVAETCSPNYVVWGGARGECGTHGQNSTLADPSLPVIPFGKLPITQLAMDYNLIENYASGLVPHDNDGRWSQGGLSHTSPYRDAMPFEPFSNCPSGVVRGGGLSWGTQGLLESQMWLSVVESDGWDQLLFTDQADMSQTAKVAAYVEQITELQPSFRGVFGSGRSTINVTEVIPGPGCFGAGHANTVRAAVWSEPSALAQNELAVCAHVVAVNTGLSPSIANLSITGGVFGFGNRSDVTAEQLFAAGPSHVLVNGTFTTWIAPGATVVYRLQAAAGGCAAKILPASCNSNNLPTGCNLANPLTRSIHIDIVDNAPNWDVKHLTVVQPPHGEYDARFNTMSDTAVSLLPARHSLKINIPTGGTPTVIALPGRQLVHEEKLYLPPPNQIQVGDAIYGGSVTLPHGRKFNVSLALQASPCGTKVELMSGHWTATEYVVAGGNAFERGSWNGSALATATLCGASWHQLTTLVNVPNGSAGSISYNHSVVVNGTREWVWTNGTALQLRITPAPSERNHGARVWVGAASIVEVAA